MDRDGSWSAEGRIDKKLLAEMLLDPFFQQPPPKSTGREYFNQTWLQGHARVSALNPADVAATLCELTAKCIIMAIHQYAPKTTCVLVCGGGIHNKTLMNRVVSLATPCAVESTTQYGIEPDWVEAAAFAWLAQQTLAGRFGNQPSVTGAREPVVLGGIYRQPSSE